MPIQLTSFLVPKNGATWAILEDTYFRGGLRVVANYAALANIPQGSRKAGMLAVAADTNQIWQLGSDAVTWSVLALGGGSDKVLPYTFEQATPSDSWVIAHNLNRMYFTLSVFDSQNRMVIPDGVTISNANEVLVEFAVPTSGHCTLMFNALV